MAAYSQIQTYVSYDGDDYKKYIGLFQNLLKELGFGYKYIDKNIKDISWIEAENGFIYSGSNIEGYTLYLETMAFNVTPLFMGWTPRVVNKLVKCWVEFKLSFDMDEITYDYGSGKLKDGYLEIILRFMKTFSKYFVEEGIYFTDEISDGLPWEALEGMDSGFWNEVQQPQIWAFDMAIIPSNINEKYKDIPCDIIKEDWEDKYIYIRKCL